MQKIKGGNLPELPRSQIPHVRSVQQKDALRQGELDFFVCFIDHSVTLQSLFLQREIFQHALKQHRGLVRTLDDYRQLAGKAKEKYGSKG